MNLLRSLLKTFDKQVALELQQDLVEALPDSYEDKIKIVTTKITLSNQADVIAWLKQRLG